MCMPFSTFSLTPSRSSRLGGPVCSTEFAACRSFCCPISIPPFAAYPALHALRTPFYDAYKRSRDAVESVCTAQASRHGFNLTCDYIGWISAIAG